ncbi:MAG TPA: polysaccharide deacetylase family protein [Chthoniobacterales bacterium]
MSPILAASASAERDALIVSVHDIAPATRDVVEKIVEELARHRVPVCSLLVVPDYHHRGPSMDDSGFVRWLQELETGGHEIVIHGYYHERPRDNGESWGDKFFTQFYTNDEGEFYDLDYDEAFRRIARGRDDFIKAGLRPRGFIAPAWLLGRAAQRAARDAEMEYTTRLARISDLRSGENFRARTLVYSVRSGWRRALSLSWNELLSSHLTGASIARVSIHPPDYQHPEIWRQILRLIGGLIENRTPTTYRDWIAEQRTRPAG